MLRSPFATRTLALVSAWALVAVVPVSASAESDDSDGRFQTLDSVDTGRTGSLDSVVLRAYPPHDRQPTRERLPNIQNGNWEEQAARAKEIIAAAEKRLVEANSAYGNMRSRQYPRGEGRKGIIDERDEAEAGVNKAWAHYGKIKNLARDSGHSL